jgi:hypothetical protein
MDARLGPGLVHDEAPDKPSEEEAIRRLLAADDAT